MHGESIEKIAAKIAVNIELKDINPPRYLTTFALLEKIQNFHSYNFQYKYILILL